MQLSIQFASYGEGYRSHGSAQSEMLMTVLLRRYVLSAEVGSGVRAEGRVGSGAGVGSVYHLPNLLHEAESDIRAGRVGV